MPIRRWKWEKYNDLDVTWTKKKTNKQTKFKLELHCSYKTGKINGLGFPKSYHWPFLNYLRVFDNSPDNSFSFLLLPLMSFLITRKCALKNDWRQQSNPCQSYLTSEGLCLSKAFPWESGLWYQWSCCKSLNLTSHPGLFLNIIPHLRNPVLKSLFSLSVVLLTQRTDLSLPLNWRAAEWIWWPYLLYVVAWELIG